MVMAVVTLDEERSPPFTNDPMPIALLRET